MPHLRRPHAHQKGGRAVTPETIDLFTIPAALLALAYLFAFHAD
jgi:hypothetical protein